MNLEETKAEIVSAIKKELLNLHVRVEDADIRSTAIGNTWSIWIEQRGGLDTSNDTFSVDLEDLMDGTNYFRVIGYRTRGWVSNYKYMADLKKSLGKRKEIPPHSDGRR